MKKVLFIDRDGTLIREPEDQQVDSFEKLIFLPGVLTELGKIAQELDYLLVIVTNQDGLGSDENPEEKFWPVHEKMLEIFRGEDVHFYEVLIDKTYASDNASTRKPGTGLLTHYLRGDYDLAQSFVIGDRFTDVLLAENLGAKAIRIIEKDAVWKDETNNESAALALQTDHWKDIYAFLKGQPRRATVSRKTKETEIAITVNLDGSGKSNISTGLGFFDHMLEQLAKHGGIDLDISVKGDLHIDEHHTVEDTGLALGQAFDAALGAKKGIARYGFLLPMDDSLAQVAIDFGGRPWLVWDASFRREKIGEMPTELFSHFFKSFSDTAKCNLNIQASGENEHHLIESIFKAWARAIRMAVAQTGDKDIPSTKGSL